MILEVSFMPVRRIPIRRSSFASDASVGTSVGTRILRGVVVTWTGLDIESRPAVPRLVPQPLGPWPEIDAPGWAVGTRTSLMVTVALRSFAAMPRAAP